MGARGSATRDLTPERIWAVTTAAHAVNPPTEADTFAQYCILYSIHGHEHTLRHN